MPKELTFSRGKSQAMYHFLPGGLIDHPREGIMKIKNWSSTRVTPTISSKNRLVTKILSALDGSKKDRAFSMLNHNTIQFFEPSNIILELFPLVFYNKRTRSHITYEPGEKGLAKMEEDVRNGRIGSGDLVQEDLVFVSKSGDLDQIYIPNCKLHPHSKKRLVKPAGRGQEAYYWYCEGCNNRYYSFFYGMLGGENVTSATPVRDPSVFRPRLFSVVNAPQDLPTNESRRAIFEQAILAKYLGHEGTVQELSEKISPKREKSNPDSKDIETLESMVETLKDPILRKNFQETIGKMKSRGNLGESIKAEVTSTFGISTEEDFLESLEKIDSIYEFLHTSKSEGVTLDMDDYENTRMPISKYNDFKRRLENIAVNKLYYSSKIPIMTVSYGYTRGNAQDDPSELKVKAFPPDSADEVSGIPPVYVNQIETEGLAIEFDREKIVEWLRLNNSLDSAVGVGENALKGWFFRNVNSNDISLFKGADEADPVTSMVFTLIHTISHSLIKELATEAGLETSSLGERIFPTVPAVLIYSNESTESTIGFLRDVFNNKIRPWVDNAMIRTYSCIYDPVCQHQGGACHYCLHLHEASCECFNKSLNRNFLIGGSNDGHTYMPFWSLIKGE